ncbi:MAG: hypothetical protein A2079_03975 [Geobacteraceae bacterium GWC2_48_7]|nr:MAG: hypothetical protein A2079_03975 [Geobacteraceae bacterium GWC2_48_7]
MTNVNFDLKKNYEIYKRMMSRMNRHAFEKYIFELVNSPSEPMGKHQELDDGIYKQELLDSYGGTLHSVFVMHYYPLQFNYNSHNFNINNDPVLKQRIKNVDKYYRNKYGYIGLVSPLLEKARQLQSIIFPTNLSNIDQSFYGEIIENYSQLVKKHISYPTPVLVGSLDSLFDGEPEKVINTLGFFFEKNADGLAITLDSDSVELKYFNSERSVFCNPDKSSNYPYEPVYMRTNKNDVIQEFEELLAQYASESKIEKFLARHYKVIFGAKYDRIETQLWLRFPDVDISQKNRRLDVFLRNSVLNDWELFEVKKTIPLTRDYRDVPVIAQEVSYAMQQVKNYARILSQDVVKKHFHKQGIEYYEPTLNLVLGRNPQIPHEQWRWLSTQDRDIKIITFDDLINEMKCRIEEKDFFLNKDGEG